MSQLLPFSKFSCWKQSKGLRSAWLRVLQPPQVLATLLYKTTTSLLPHWCLRECHHPGSHSHILFKILTLSSGCWEGEASSKCFSCLWLLPQATVPAAPCACCPCFLSSSFYTLLITLQILYDDWAFLILLSLTPTSTLMETLKCGTAPDRKIIHYFSDMKMTPMTS